jgi:hypothetical protein
LFQQAHRGTSTVDREQVERPAGREPDTLADLEHSRRGHREVLGHLSGRDHLGGDVAPGEDLRLGLDARFE